MTPPALAVPQDEVIISDTARQAQTIRRNVYSLPDIRRDKVEEIKSRMKNGTYAIDTDKVAEKMVKEHIIDELI